MDYDGRVVFKIDGDDSGLKKAVNGAESSLSGLKSTIVKLGLGALLTKGMTDAVKATNAFETSLAKASTLFGSVAVDTDNLSKRIMALSTATGQTAESIGGSLYNALSAGVSVTEDMGEAMTFLESATKLSVAGFTDVDTAVTATAKVMNAYGMSVAEASRIGEVLMETQNLGITTVNELGGALATVTPIASSFGVSFEQVGASMAVMTKQGTDTATATTQLRQLISELGQDGTTASKNLQNAFKRMGFEYRNFADYIRDPNNNLQGAIKLLQEEADIAGLSLSDMFGNIRAGVGALQLAQDEMGVFNQFMTDMAGDTKLVEDAYSKMMDTRTNKWKKMREQLKNITISITNSEAVQGILNNITDTAQKFLNRIEEWIPTMTSALAQFRFNARVVFAYLKKLYDDSFLKKLMDFSIKIVSNELQEFADKFKNGDLFGAIVQIAEDGLILAVGFSLIKTGIHSLASLLGGFTLGWKSLGFVSFGLAGLELAMGVKWAMDEGKWEQFTGALLLALIPATIAGAFLGVQAGALVFGITFKFLRSIATGPKDPTAEAEKKAKEDPTSSADELIDMVHTSQEAREAMKSQVKDVSDYASEMRRLTDILNDNFVEFDTIQAKLKEALTIDIGRNAVLGMLEGTDESDIDNWSRYFCAMVLQAMRNAFNIQSPSKVMKDEVGYWIGLGVAEGIWSTATSSAIDESVDKILDRIIKDVEEGNLSPSIAFSLYPKIKAYGEAEKNRLASGSPATSGRTTGGGGINSMEGWTLDSNGTWIQPPEPTNWQRFWTSVKEGADNFFSAMAIGSDTGIQGLFKLTEGMTTVEDGITVLTEKGKFWSDLMNDSMKTIMSSFETFGQDLVAGTAGWKSFARAGLDALASILEALGYQLASMAISTYPNFAQMALSASGSALAFTFAGLVRGEAGKFERGGIVGGSGITGDRHMVFANAGELILSKAQQGAIASQLGGGSGPAINITFSGQVFGDEATISEYVYNGIRTAQREGVIGSW